MELSERKRSEYLDLRHRYEPRSAKLVVIAELGSIFTTQQAPLANRCLQR
jgi:hypothetical protein